jgi:acylphosphatase
MNEGVTLRLSIRGRVQGVGYRYAMVVEARRLGLSGWVRNRRDGSVEALIQGSAEAVATLREWAAHGPPAAQVDTVEATPADGAFEGFETRPSA